MKKNAIYGKTLRNLRAVGSRLIYVIFVLGLVYGIIQYVGGFKETLRSIPSFIVIGGGAFLCFYLMAQAQYIRCDKCGERVLANTVFPLIAGILVGAFLLLLAVGEDYSGAVRDFICR